MQPGRRGTSRRGARLVAEINVTPFVDVMLVLLVIFMITAPLLTSTVQVDLPQTQAARATGQDEPLVVSVNSGGKPNAFKVRFTDVWENQGGTWRMVTWQSTRLAD